MNSSKIQPVATQPPTIDKKAEKRPQQKNTENTSTNESYYTSTNPTTHQYDSDDNEYDDMSEMMDLIKM